MSRIRNCICCGKEYEYCPNCNNGNKPSWMISFDSEECKELFNAISGYNMGIKKKEDVKIVLDKYNITDFSNYSDGVKDVLNKLFQNKKNKKHKQEMDIDFTEKEELVEEPIIDLSGDEGVSI